MTGGGGAPPDRRMDRGMDWPGLMRVGLRGLGLAPGAFWALTPNELLVMLGQGAAAPPMGRARLEELGRAYQDRPAGQGDGEAADG